LGASDGLARSCVRSTLARRQRAVWRWHRHGRERNDDSDGCESAGRFAAPRLL